MKQDRKLRNMVLMAMMAAVAVVLMMFELPLPMIAPAFYKLDFSEVPVLIGTFAMGPLAGVGIEFLKILLHLLISGTSTAYVGDIANFLIGCSFVIPAGCIYQRAKSRKHAIAGMAAGTLTMTAAGVVLNALVLLPWYAANFFAAAGGMEALVRAGAAVNAGVTNVWAFVFILVAPFNLIKGAAISLITLVLYKRVSVLIKGHAADAVTEEERKAFHEAEFGQK